MADHLFEDKRPDIHLIMTEEAMVCYNLALERLRNPLSMDGLDTLGSELEKELQEMRDILRQRVKTLEILAKAKNPDPETTRRLTEEIRKRGEGVKLVQGMLARISKGLKNISTTNSK